MEVASIMKGAYDHFMQKEIHEQPESLAQTLMGRIKLIAKTRRSFRSNSTGSVSDSDCSDSGMSCNSDGPNNLLGCKVRPNITFLSRTLPCELLCRCKCPARW
jgi:hypothetical protein